MVVVVGGVAEAVLVVDGVDVLAVVVDCVDVVVVVVVVDSDEVVDGAAPEPPDPPAPFVPPWSLLCVPFSVPVGDFDFVGFVPPDWFWWPDVGLAGVWNWMVAVPPAPPETWVTWTLTS